MGWECQLYNGHVIPAVTCNDDATARLLERQGRAEEGDVEIVPPARARREGRGACWSCRDDAGAAGVRTRGLVQWWHSERQRLLRN